MGKKYNLEKWHVFKKIVKKIKSDFINRHESLYKLEIFIRKYIVPEQRFGQEFLIRAL